MLGLENHMEENIHGIFHGMFKPPNWPAEPAHIHPISKGIMNFDTL
jgi:hypothetical protein